MTTTEELVEDRLMGAAEALNLSSAGRVGPAVATLKRRKRRRQGAGAVALSLAVLGGGFVASRPSDSGNVSTDFADSEQSVTEDDNLQYEPEILFDFDLRTDLALWPVEALPLDELLETFANDVLNWPGAIWTEPYVVPRDEDSHLVSVQKPGDSDSSLIFVLEQRAQDWVVAGTANSLQLNLQDGNLVGIRLADASQVGKATTWLESRYSTPYSQGYGGGPDVDGLLEKVGKSSLLVPPEDAGSFLVIGRDDDMAATFVQGIALGFPDRLTLNLDSLGPGQSLDEIDTVWARSDSWGQDDVGPLDLEHVHFFEDAQPGFDVYLVPLVDRSGICYWLVAGEFAGSSCTGSTRFNKYGASSGLSSGSGAEESVVEVFIVPDGVEIGDIGDAVVLASGNVVVASGSDYLQHKIVDGVLRLE